MTHHQGGYSAASGLRPASTRRKGCTRAAALLAAAASLAFTPAAAQDDPVPDTLLFSVNSLVASARPGTRECLPPPGPAPSRVRPPAAAPLRTRVVLLGTGTPIPDPHRSGPAVAVIVDGQVYLVDAGAGLVRQAAAAVEQGVLPLAAQRLHRVFVTHLHSDHTLGLPDVLMTPWVMLRDSSLRAWGPAGLRDMARGLVQAWEEDVLVRLNAEAEGRAAGLMTVVCEVPRVSEGAVVYRDDRVVVTAFAVKHGDWNVPDAQRAFGFRFDTPDLSVVISGDTGPAPEVFERYCGGCDLLVHEVYAVKHRGVLGEDRTEYDSAFHTSSVLLADSVARGARPGLLVLYHLGLMPGVSEQDLLDEVTSRYQGRVCVGHDLDVFEEGAGSPCTPPSASPRQGRPEAGPPRGGDGGTG